MNHKSLLQFTVLAMALLPATLRAEDDSSNPRSVYTMDNASSGNSVLAFQRAANGSLIPAGSFATGGTGTGGGLGNQGAVLLTHDGRWLFACNAGSHEISVFAVRPDGLLLTDKVGSGGRRPLSLTLHRNLLYVLNAGGAVGDADNITGFEFQAGKLFAISGSTRALSAGSTGPAQVSFTGDGEVLVVTEKATGIIDTFTIGEDGLAGGHKMFASPVPTPFWVRRGQGGAHLCLRGKRGHGECGCDWVIRSLRQRRPRRYQQRGRDHAKRCLLGRPDAQRAFRLCIEHR